MNKKLFELVPLSGILIFTLSLTLIFSCKTSKKTTIPEPHSDRLDYKSPRTLMDQMQKNEFNYTWLSSKFSCEANVDDKSHSFTVNLRSRKDSILWMSISGLGIEAVRILITKDSVKLRNNLNKNYFAGDFNYLSKMLNTELDFAMVQSLLVGNSFEFYEEDEKLKSAKDNNKYLLSTVRRRRLKRVLERNEAVRELVQIIWLEPETFKISRILVNDNVTNRTFDVNYSNFQKVDSASAFPYSAKFLINAEKKIKIDVSYSKVNVNTPQAFPFSIPESYERKN